MLYYDGRAVPSFHQFVVVEVVIAEQVVGETQVLTRMHRCRANVGHLTANVPIHYFDSTEGDGMEVGLRKNRARVSSKVTGRLGKHCELRALLVLLQ